MRQRSNLKARVTVITNEFIDEYMPTANGEYVKVYLYLLRHEERPVEIAEIADALNHTEADVKRALGYWEKAGVLVRGSESEQRQGTAMPDNQGQGVLVRVPGSEQQPAADRSPEPPQENTDIVRAGTQTGPAEAAAMTAATSAHEAPEALQDRNSGEMPAGAVRPQGNAAAMLGMPLTPPELFPPRGTAGTIPVPPEHAGDGCERLERLSGDEEFSALLYAVQQYLGKTFTQVECEKFAFFYDGLDMTGELLEYLAEYCAGGGHTSIRYIEKVALNWYQMGIRTREDAKNHTMRFSKDTSSVMKAFGITNRSPGTAEQEYMRKWFREYGFDESLVVEACSRTIKATGAASFPYADKILTGWKESGVRALRDVAELDKKRQKNRGQAAAPQLPKKPASNRFKNFDERSYDYEKYVWEGMRRRQAKGGVKDGSQ